MTKWLIVLAALAVLFLALLAFAALSGFADVPCQDGVWNEAQHRCIPIPG